MNDISASFDDFMATRAKVAEAYVSGDPAPLVSISTRSDPATFFGPQGGVVEGAQAVLSTNEAGSRQFAAGGDTRLEILHMAADDHLAYWVGIQHANIVADGQAAPISMELRITELFRREDDDWKLIHRHADQLSAPPDDR
jgi:ketosteroid isomerase-like protein